MTCSNAYAQLPVSHVYMSQLKDMATNPKMGKISYLSSFNAKGYNNQVHFLDYNTLWISSNYNSDSTTDIIQIDLSNETFSKWTNTPSISEFSPQISPRINEMTTVRIESDKKTQTLWSYPLDQSHQGARLLSHFDNVGYHVWLNSTQLAVFTVEKSNRLWFCDIHTQQCTQLLDNIGRCLKSDKKGQLYFIHTIADDKNVIKKFNPIENVIENIVVLPQPYIKDFEVLPNEDILIGDKSRIMHWKKTDNTWHVIEDLMSLGIRDIQRIVVFRDRIAFINTP